MQFAIKVGHKIEITEEDEFRLAQEKLLSGATLDDRDKALLDACVSFTLRTLLAKPIMRQKMGVLN